MIWGLVWDWEDSGYEWEGLRDSWLVVWFSPGGNETWYWNFDRDSPVLGRGSCKGSCVG